MADEATVVDPMERIADSLSGIAYEMGERDGADLADVDPLVPTPETYLQRSRRQ